MVSYKATLKIAILQWFPFSAWKNKNWKSRKTRSKLGWQKEYVIHIRNLKQALIDRLVLKKVHRVIKFNEEAWLKLFLDMKTELEKKNTKNDLKKDIFKLINNAVFEKNMKNVRENRDIKLVNTEAGRN